jgi:predicted ATP-dependent protease
MTGPSHHRAFITLTGYLNGKYGQEIPLSISASISHEQSPPWIDGNSASSAELYSLLSELSGLPVSQGIAVTGAVNQDGDVQAIGGTTYKIEGFFDICQSRGLNGAQGVMVPVDNLKDLLLKDEVIQAVRDGLFHIYQIKTVNEGIEVLTGVPAGEAGTDGKYPEGTVHRLVERRLAEMARTSRDWAKNKESGEHHAEI